MIYNFSKYFLPIYFLRDIYEWYLWLKDPDDEQNKYANELESMDKGIKSTEKKSYFSITDNYFYCKSKCS